MAPVRELSHPLFVKLHAIVVVLQWNTKVDLLAEMHFCALNWKGRDCLRSVEN